MKKTISRLEVNVPSTGDSGNNAGGGWYTVSDTRQDAPMTPLVMTRQPFIHPPVSVMETQSHLPIEDCGPHDNDDVYQSVDQASITLATATGTELPMEPNDSRCYNRSALQHGSHSVHR